ncbi:ABC transporter substrate-binding protein [Streptomyces clavifer]|uniref:ABC transporter substrate-binding protein n=1 Tax=Streptomyces clavifer TaxID=68188 RepID=UPI002E80C28C|nr:extracellular solute-binding protein [Streptomyces clavifer]WRY81801.1 extracellular solute-binding protein [Streptomyces clavifer]WUC27563.1 extracellular solute-binding protein [Streptomyces clavifer]
MRTTTRRAMRGVGLLCAAALSLTACGSDGTGDDAGSDKAVTGGDLRAALKEGGSITVWAWEPTLKQVVSDFQERYPKVKVKLVNAGTGNDQYTALQNAVQAGAGVPDVAQVEYYALGQFALGKSLEDLSRYGASDFKRDYSPGPWNAVTIDDAVYALPMDSGPMALYFNKKVLDKHQIATPTTWDEYLDAARKLHAADPNAYITNDTGDAGFTTSMIWQAGGTPFKTRDTSVTVDLVADKGVTAYTEVWQKLIDEKLLAPISSWSDEWYAGLADGTIATLATGAWMPANFASGVKAASGDWRAAPLPQWEKGAEVSSENGGSSLAVMKAGKNKKLAYAFNEYANHSEGVQSRVENGAFPATTADLTSTTFLSTTFPYFGGQKANEIFALSATQVPEEWSYLPFQVYANSIFNDTVGKAYATDTTLADGLKAWQKASADYGTEQGFDVNK